MAWKEPLAWSDSEVDSYSHCDHLDCVPHNHAEPPAPALALTGPAITLAGGVIAATQLKEPVSRRQLFTFGFGKDRK